MAVIDLSQLPAPQIVDVPDFETLLAERKAEFVALHPKDEQEAVIRTLELESEPATKLLQENAYRELLLRQRINEAAQAVMVAYAMGGDLDQLAANYNVTRLTVTPADNDAVPPVAAVMESDEALRLRVPAAFEGLSVAGPTAAYEFHARSADGRVADASATSPAPAEVVLTVLSREGDGTAEKDLLDVVEKALNSENVRPVADRLTVRSAEIIPYRVEATIFLYPGPEAEPVMAAAKASLQKYIASQTRLGRDIRRSAIFAALHVEGVQRVDPNFATTMLNALAGKQPLDNTLTNLSGKDVAGLLTYLGLGEGSALPVGVPVPWPSATPPTGWLKCNGAAFSAEEYPELAKVYPTNKLPDLRGEFIRGWDDGRGIDTNRSLLSSQGDTIRNITGFINEVKGTIDTATFRLQTGTGAFALASQATRNIYNNLGTYETKNTPYTGFSFDASRVVPTASENRPRNIAFNYIVRAA